jgi:hypothetical protein
MLTHIKGCLYYLEEQNGEFEEDITKLTQQVMDSHKSVIIQAFSYDPNIIFRARELLDKLRRKYEYNYFMEIRDSIVEIGDAITDGYDRSDNFITLNIKFCDRPQTIEYKLQDALELGKVAHIYFYYGSQETFQRVFQKYRRIAKRINKTLIVKKLKNYAYYRCEFVDPQIK